MARGRPKGSGLKALAAEANNSTFGSTPVVDTDPMDDKPQPFPGKPPMRPGMAAILKSKGVKLKTVPPGKSKAPGGGGFGPPKSKAKANPY